MIKKSHAKRGSIRGLAVPLKLAASGSFCPLRGMFALLDSRLRGNDGLMNYSGSNEFYRIVDAWNNGIFDLKEQRETT